MEIELRLPMPLEAVAVDFSVGNFAAEAEKLDVIGDTAIPLQQFLEQNSLFRLMLMVIFNDHW